jgi:S-methylmethionine-dependent homocysteine/selenocysteine methylase
MARDAPALTDGGVETSLCFHEGFELPCFASFPLLADARGRAAIRRYFEPFLDTAQERGLPFVLDTATWRANPDWGVQLGYDGGALAAANRDAVEFARELAGRRPDVTINGVLGPRGEGYVAGERVDRATGGAAEFFMLNCAHPSHIAAGLDAAPALDRIGGLRANASALSHAELDDAEELDEGDPVALGRANAALRDRLPSVRLLGGCCGTDHRHVAEIIAAWDSA